MGKWHLFGRSFGHSSLGNVEYLLLRFLMVHVPIRPTYTTKAHYPIFLLRDQRFRRSVADGSTIHYRLVNLCLVISLMSIEVHLWWFNKPWNEANGDNYGRPKKVMERVCCSCLPSQLSRISQLPLDWTTTSVIELSLIDCARYQTFKYCLSFVVPWRSLYRTVSSGQDFWLESPRTLMEVRVSPYRLDRRRLQRLCSCASFFTRSKFNLGMASGVGPILRSAGVLAPEMPV